jgi:hypothetical protein
MKDAKPPEDVSDDEKGAGAFRISISNENFLFRTVEIADQKVTGAQITQAAGQHPVEDYVVLQQLKTRELESIRPGELLDLAANGVERFFVIKGADLHRFFVDGLSLEWPRATLSGAHVLELVDADEDMELILEREDTADEVIDDDEEVRLDTPGAERFKTRKATKQIIIFVDGEEYAPPTRTMAPNEIIRQAAGKDPAQNYLAQITGGQSISYKDVGDEPIRLRNRMKFQVIFTGATPVSDPAVKTGVDHFIAGLRELGFAPVALSGQPDKLVFDYKVESGKFAGKDVKLGLVIPADFPMTPPSGPYVSPEIHPIHPDADPHPAGAVHKTQAEPFEAGTGGAWQYWSRPFPGWGQNGKRTVAAYMAHIWTLWETQ